MFNSKALKDSWYGCGCKPGQDPEHGFLKRILHSIWYFIKFELMYPVESFYHRYKERIGRSIAFARHGWLSYDFDAHTLHNLMQFKLKRVKKALEEGHAIQEKEDMDALNKAIKLCGRIYRDNYEWVYHREHDKKWGKRPRFDYVPYNLDKNDKPLTYRLVFKDRPNVKNEEDKQLERKEFMSCYEKGLELKNKDMDALNELFKKYLCRWWD